MIRKSVIVLAVILLLFPGCCSHSPQTSAASTDLGIVEVSTSKECHYSLSGGRDCTVRLTALADGRVLVEAVVLRKHDGDKVDVLARPRIITPAGQKVSLPIDNGNLQLTPKRI